MQQAQWFIMSRKTKAHPVPPTKGEEAKKRVSISLRLGPESHYALLVIFASRSAQAAARVAALDGYSVQTEENGVSPCLCYFRVVHGAVRVLADLAWPLREERCHGLD